MIVPLGCTQTGQQKSVPLGSGFLFLVRSRSETDPSGTFYADLFLTEGNESENWLYSGQHSRAEYHPTGDPYAGTGRG